MKRIYEIPVLGGWIKLFGIQKKANGSERAHYVICGEIDPEETQSSDAEWLNGVSIEGNPETKIEVLKVLRLKERDQLKKETETLRPFWQGEKIKKFSSHHEIHVVVEDKTFSISNRKFPTGLIVFEAGEHQKSRFQNKLPAEATQKSTKPRTKIKTQDMSAKKATEAHA